nr:hypothetical protein [uncultured Mucilaginibacter sp.]
MKPLHRNLLIASNLYRASALLTVLAYFLSGKEAALPEVLVIAITLVVAYLIRAGLNWLKWILLAWDLFYLPFFVMALLQPWTGKVGINLLAIAIDLLQIIALVFLFLPRKEEPEEEPVADEEQPSDIE